jgi:multidrug efflux pump
VETNPLILSRYGLGFEDIRATLASANAHTQKDFIDMNGRCIQLDTNDQAHHAADYRGLMLTWRNGHSLHLA